MGRPMHTISGEPVDSPRRLPVLNPATLEVCGDAPQATPEQVDAAAQSAARAFRTWSARPQDERRTIVRAWLEVLREQAGVLAEWITLEQGKPLDKALGELQSALRFGSALAEIDLPPQVLRDEPGQRVELHRRPLGVVAAITAWNYPVLLAVWKIVPALVTGNTVVLKPAPTTPLSSLRLGELGAGVLPPGVLNVIAGDDDCGARLVSRPEVRKVAFTGSGRTGQRIMADAAPTLKRLTLELGGNDAGIVLPGTDLAAIANDLFWAKFSNAGQVCAGLKRLYVHASQHDALCEALATVARGVRVGDGRERGVQMGPLQNAAQRARLQQQLDEALAGGARIAYRGEVPAGPGHWFPITLLSDAAPGMRVVDEEAFGPLLTLHRYREVDDAVAAANASGYGLGGSVWGRDVARASALALRLEAGTVWVNQHPAMGPDIPFGGWKGSGLGVEFGRAGVEAYTEQQVLNVRR